MTKILYVTHFCPHYRVRTFEILSSKVDIEFLFFSQGKEWYWLEENRIRQGNFRHQYLKSFSVLGTIISFPLIKNLFIKDYDVVIKGINGRFAVPITFLIAKLRKKPFILWTGVWTRINTGFHRLFYPITKFIYQHSDAIVVYGQHVKNHLIDEGISPDNIFNAHHAVDNESYNAKIPSSEKNSLLEKLGIAPDKKIILYLGRLEPSKGLEYLLEAFAKCSDHSTVLAIAGTGSLMEPLKQLTAELNISNHVQFIGYIPVEEAIRYYAIAQIFVLPSITTPHGKEPWGLVVNEAMNQGVPVIASNAVGAAAGGLVQDGINGFIVPERDAEALADRLNILLKDGDLLISMSANAKEIVAGWDNERMVDGYLQAIDYVKKK